jgi:beta-1,3-galactosyl-O-glycosyl-glycoprotein beta-1,6-N-acetylglucosaminyltransferase/N-acetyllactosaminide beta-1,6-N-acetylglucosaminyltransferase
VDGNSPPVLHIALNGIANCFENVFIVSKTEKVFYKHMTRLKADLNCMTHQTFPLKTNLEIVKILKINNGSNDIEGIITPKRMSPYRFKFRHRYIHKTHSWVSIGRQHSRLPHNAAMVKGSTYGIFSRSFVRFAIHDKKAKDILDYLEDVKSPDEYYWAILNHNKVLQAPGQFTGEILILG